MLRTFIQAIHFDHSPHKLILIYLENRDRVAQALAKRICKELQEVYLNARETDKLIDSPQIPYTVVITDRTMFDGVIGLRHNKPKITEEVHVSNLKDRLLSLSYIK